MNLLRVRKQFLNYISLANLHPISALLICSIPRAMFDRVAAANCITLDSLIISCVLGSYSNAAEFDSHRKRTLASQLFAFEWALFLLCSNLNVPGKKPVRPKRNGTAKNRYSSNHPEPWPKPRGSGVCVELWGSNRERKIKISICLNAPFRAPSPPPALLSRPS